MDALSATAVAPGSSVENRKLFYTTIASTLAWACDLFDLFIILFVAPTIGQLFFPSDNAMLSLASVYGAYAVTVVMRPLGSAIFGSFADRSGRRRAMIVAVTGIGIVTGVMGLLPTYPQAGLLAPFLFLALRILQGVFVGGVTATSHTIAAESVPPRLRGIITGIVATGAAIGSLFASAAFWGVSLAFPGDSFAVWGWRVMFFLGLVPLLLGAMIYLFVGESPLWLDAASQGRKSRAPLRDAYSRQNLGANIVTLMLVVGAGIQIYLTQSYLPAFMKLVNKVPNGDLGAILMVANFAAIAATPLFGHLSQVFGRKRIFLVLGVANLILIPYCYTQLSHLTPDALGLIYLYAAVLTFCGNAPLGPMIIFLNERFPTKTRATGVAVSWSIGFAVGGMMPTFVTLASRTAANIPSALMAFLLVAIGLYIVGALIVPETRGNMEAGSRL